LFHPQCERPSIAPIQHNWQNYYFRKCYYTQWFYYDIIWRIYKRNQNEDPFRVLGPTDRDVCDLLCNC
jgi:hypothetical protein